MRGQQEVFAYQLDDGTTIKATADHKFMTADGDMLAIDTIYERGLDLLQVEVPSPTLQLASPTR
jgi:DNA polymerase III subunit alpha